MHTEVSPPMFTSRFMPCPECGASADRTQGPRHTCQSERLIDYRMFGLRDDVAQFEPRLRDHLDSSAGRFEVWLAARSVRAGGR